MAGRSGMRFLLVSALIAGWFPAPLLGQLLEPGAQSSAPNPLTDTTVKPGKVLLYDLEARFAKDVAARGGAAFADWFAEDGVALGNGAAPKIGKVAIAKSATWSPPELPADLDAHRCHDGSFRGYGLYLGPLRRPQQGFARKSCAHQRPLYDYVAQRAGR